MQNALILLAVSGLCPALFAGSPALKELKLHQNETVIINPANIMPVSAKDETPGFNEVIPAARKAEFPTLLQKKSDKTCTVIDQDGTQDSYSCRNSPGKIRCYADLKVNGIPLRVLGGCASSYSDCWSSGSGGIKDPCDAINHNPGNPSNPGNPGNSGNHGQSGCKIEDQDSTLDTYACRNSEGQRHCYADVINNGSSYRVFGGCWPSMSDCWSSGSGAVNPCD